MTRSLDRKGWNWAPVPAEVILSHKLNHTDVRVYAYLLWRSGNKAYAWPAAETIGTDLGMSTVSVLRSFKHLLDDNWIKRLRRMNKSSVTYIFETQKECQEFSRTYHQGYDEHITGDMTDISQVIRVNENQLNKSKKKSREKNAPPIPPHPAVEAYRQASKLYPTKAQWEPIVAAVGADPVRLDLWHRVVEAYVLRGWNPRNIGGMLDYFQRGEVPGQAVNAYAGRLPDGI